MVRKSVSAHFPFESASEGGFRVDFFDSIMPPYHRDDRFYFPICYGPWRVCLCVLGSMFVSTRLRRLRDPAQLRVWLRQKSLHAAG